MKPGCQGHQITGGCEKRCATRCSAAWFVNL
jgi:hypothetical protein